tara:strand:- start:1921 stop:2082 length:162 start_codon:yes stop_codon:yes gene_type:complete
MYELYASLPVVPQFSEMEELLVSSEEFYREVGEQGRFEIDVHKPERACVEIEM